MLDYASIPLEEEYADEHKSCSIPPGILHLAEALIECAIADIRYNRKHGRMAALRWIMGNDRAYLFSFLNVCALIQVDPAQIRRAVHAFLAGNSGKKRKG